MKIADACIRKTHGRLCLGARASRPMSLTSTAETACVVHCERSEECAFRQESCCVKSRFLGPTKTVGPRNDGEALAPMVRGIRPQSVRNRAAGGRRKGSGSRSRRGERGAEDQRVCTNISTRTIISTARWLVKTQGHLLKRVAQAFLPAPVPARRLFTPASAEHTALPHSDVLDQNAKIGSGGLFKPI